MFRKSSIACGLISVVLAVASSGCGGDDGLEKRIPISGKVTYDGQPLKKGKITFVPQEADKRGGGGAIEDGQIVDVTTQSPGDGLLPGKYKVAINAAEEVDVAGVAKKYHAAPDPVALGKAQAKAKSGIPKKYANAFDSGLTAEVSSSNRTLDYELKN